MRFIPAIAVLGGLAGLNMQEGNYWAAFCVLLAYLFFLYYGAKNDTL